MPDLATVLSIDQGLNAPPPAVAAGGAQYMSAADMQAAQGGGLAIKPNTGPTSSTAPGDAGPTAVPTPQPAAFGYQWSDPALAAKMAAAESAINSSPQKPSAPTGKKTGYVANIGAGTGEAVAGLLGMPVDVATAVLNLPIQGVNAIAGTNIPTIHNPVGGTGTFEGLENLLPGGPGNVAPADKGEELARAASRGVTSMALPGGVARALPEAAGAAEGVRAALASGATPTGVAMGAVGGASGQVAADAVPDQYKPLADFLGQLGGGLLTGGVVSAGQALGRGAAALGDRAIAPLTVPGRSAPLTDETGAPFVGPGGAPVTATPAQARLAGERIASAAGAPPAEVAASIPPDRPLVPGWTDEQGVAHPPAQPTLGQATGNTGILGLERELRNRNRVPFTDAEAANNSARLAALQNLAPADQGLAAREFFERQLATLEARGQAEAVAGQGAAADQLHGLGGNPATTSMQAEGAAMRPALEALRQPEKAAASRLYDAVDPDGKLALDVSPVAQAAKELLAEVNPRMGGKLAGPETDVLTAAAAMRPVELFSDLRDLDSNVSAAMREIKADPKIGAESRPFARLVALRSAIWDAMGQAVGEKAGEEAQAVASGAKAPAETILGRLQTDAGQTDAVAGAVGAAAPRPGSISDGQPAAGGTVGAAGVRGGEGAAAGRRGSPGGDRSVAPAAPTQRVGRKPESLIDFLIARGGVQDQTGDLRAIGAETVHHQQGGRLVNSRGMYPDYAREAAEEAGFLRPGSTMRDLYDAIAEHVSGRPVYRVSEQHEGDLYERAQREAVWNQAAETTARQSVNAASVGGPRLSADEIDHATQLVMQGAHPLDAIEQAARAGEENVLQRNAQAAAFGRPGVPIAAQQGEIPVYGGSKLTPNARPEDIAALKAANARYAAYKDIYRRGAVGDVLASGPNGGYRLVESQVPKTLFNGGAKGAEAADGLIRVAGSVGKAQEILGDYPAFSLRQAAERNGVLDPARVDRWLADNKAALDKFPALRTQFENAANAQRAVQQAAERYQTGLKAFQDGAARHYLGQDVQKAIDGIMGSKNPEAEAASLMRRVGNDRAAREGVQRNLADWLIAKARSTAEAGTTGEKEIAGGVYQRTIAQPKIARAMAQIFTPDQLEMAQRIGKSIEIAARAYNATKIPGSPGTAADLHALAKHGGSPSLLSQVVIGELGGEAANVLAGATGVWGLAIRAAGTVGSIAYNAARAAGIGKVDDIATAGVLNPELGRLLLKAAVTDPKSPLLPQLGRRLAAASLAASGGAPGEPSR